MPSDAVLASLLAAVEAAPDDRALRVHLSELLIDAGRPAEALSHLSAVLAVDPGDADARAALRRATTALAGAAPAPAASPSPDPGFDWSAAERELGDVDHPFAQPAFLDTRGEGGDPDRGPDGDPLSAYRIERPGTRLADVGGMEEVKQRLETAFLGPMRHPELRRAFAKNLRGGLLLYGPPGCGKTFLAQALAGELEARFASVSLADVLDMWVGASERNVKAVFDAARRAAPCVLFLDEVDALGHKRTQLGGAAQRGSVNQLLTELDGVGSSNDGVFVLAATNAPWDVDPALRRPGRLDRTVLVLPPDGPAREAILRSHLARRPVTGIDLPALARATPDFSGADLAHLVDTAAERALAASVAAGRVVPITMKDLRSAAREVRPSTGAWLASARNVAEFANDHGEYDDLAAYLRRRRML